MQYAIWQEIFLITDIAHVDINKTVTIKTVSHGDLSSEEQKAVEQSVEASKTAYAPYSQFYVGCALLMEDGAIILGSNQENASFPSGLCAERVALFDAAKNLKQNMVKTIVVHAESDQYKVPELLVPCAACLQVISDIEIRQGAAMKIILRGKDGKHHIASGVAQFLPFHFELHKNN